MLRKGALCVVRNGCPRLAASRSRPISPLKRAGLVVERKDAGVSYSLAENAEASGFLGHVWALVAGDPQVKADARLARGLRRVPVEDLCRVDLDVTRFGLKRRATG